MTLKKQVVSGVKWTTLSAGSTLSLQFLSTVVLARLLAPSDFGLMAMITVVTGFAQAFADMGISNAIIHRRDTTREQLSSLYWLNIFAGIVVFALIVCSSSLLAEFYREPRLRGLLMLAACTFIITPIGQQFQVLLQKDLLFRSLTIIEIAAVLGGTVVSVTSALAGKGVMALIYGQLANSALRSTLLAVHGMRNWRPGLHFRRRDLHGYLSFGLFQMGERSINYLSSHVDYLVIGRYLGSSELGTYRLAYELVVMPIGRLNPILTRVAFPAFAIKQEDDKALRRGFLQMSKLISIAVLPIMVCLAALASLAIPVAFGPKWQAAVPLVQILSVMGMIKALGNTSGSMLLAKGRTDIGFILNVVVATANTAVFVWTVRHGVYVLAWSYVALTVGYFLASRQILNRVIGLGLGEYLGVLLKPLACSVCTGAFACAGNGLLGMAGLPEAARLAVLAPLGILVYCLLIMRFERDFIREIRLLVTKKGESN